MRKTCWFFISIIISFSCGDGDVRPVNNDATDLVSLDNCPVIVSGETLDIMTWNIEQFPMAAITTAMVQQIIEIYDMDVIALQEITSTEAFNALLSGLDGWSGYVTRVNGSNLMLAYLYKESEITLEGSPINLYEEANDDNNYAFTAFRRPYLMKVKHSNGLSVNLINIHLKCCNGSEDRRRAAANSLKEHIDNNLASEEVMVLGDFNDDIIDSDNVFQVFIEDPENYRFSTLPIANGPSAGWSYPSWPSQIDNILITDELFDNEISTEVLRIGDCVPTYESMISDHRPVLIRLQSDQ